MKSKYYRRPRMAGLKRANKAAKADREPKAPKLKSDAHIEGNWADIPRSHDRTKHRTPRRAERKFSRKDKW